MKGQKATASGPAGSGRRGAECRREIVRRANRVVLKLGSSVMVGLARSRAERALDEIGATVTGLAGGGVQFVIVSSGAIATGMTQLGLAEKPKTIPAKQAVAAVGQPTLMQAWQRAFGAQGTRVAQILLTHADLADRRRYLNARHTLTHLARMGVVPIVNENDTVAVEEIRFGDNDRLAAMITSLVQANLLVILTDQEGLYDRDPRGGRGRLIPIVDANGEALLDTMERLPGALDALDGASPSGIGSGGILSKYQAARTAAAFGVPTIVARGTRPDVLREIFKGDEEVGTLFLPAPAGERLRSRKHWIAFTLRPDGEIVVDDGAREAVASRGRSLLPSGILDVKGEFEAGDAVAILDSSGREFARGLAGYGSSEIRKIRGAKSGEIEERLGYRAEDEVVHRDDLVVTLREGVAAARDAAPPGGGGG